MTRPVFGDRETIERTDPYRVILHDGLDIPLEVLCCAECDGQLHAEFDDTWVNEKEFGAMILRWYCTVEYLHDQDYETQDDVMRDENKILKWIKSKYPAFVAEV